MSLLLVRCKNCGQTLLTTDRQIDRQTLNNLLSSEEGFCGNMQPVLERIERVEFLSIYELIRSAYELPPYIIYHTKKDAKEHAEEIIDTLKESGL